MCQFKKFIEADLQVHPCFTADMEASSVYYYWLGHAECLIVSSCGKKGNASDNRSIIALSLGLIMSPAYNHEGKTATMDIVLSNDFFQHHA